MAGTMKITLRPLVLILAMTTTLVAAEDSLVIFDMETQRCFRRDLKYDFE